MQLTKKLEQIKSEYFNLSGIFKKKEDGGIRKTK